MQWYVINGKVVWHYLPAHRQVNIWLILFKYAFDSEYKTHKFKIMQSAFFEI